MSRQQKLFFNKNLNAILFKAFSSSPETIFKVPSHDDILPYSKIPGPKFIDLNMLPGGKLHGKPMIDFHRYLRQKYGEILRIRGFFGKKDLIFVYDPNDIATVFRKSGKWPIREGMEAFAYFREKIRPDVFKSYGLVTQQHESWHKLRSVVNPIMMRPDITDLYFTKIDEIAQDFINIVRNKRDEMNETPSDFGKLLQRWGLESIGVVALDTRLNALEDNDSKGARLAELVDLMFLYTFKLDILPSPWRYFKTPSFKKFMKVMDEMTKIGIEYIDNSLEKFDENSKGVMKELLKKDKDIALVMAFDMLIAGIDTTTSTMKTMLYYLAKNQDKQEKLRTEIRSILPKKTSQLDPIQFKNLPYLRACVKESLRIIPVVLGTARQLQHDLIIKNYFLPKGTNMILPIETLMRDDGQFPLADKFIPERWLRNDEHQNEGCPHAKQAHPFAYLPFGFGERICIGKRFAELEIAILTSRMVRNFQISWHHSDLKQRSTTVNTLEGELRFRLEDVVD
uniref:CSON009018 protein n=1 Tax=Culicoides sonorensis TaxID=179676 RepID=A0A336M3C6_CULSO